MIDLKINSSELVVVLYYNLFSLCKGKCHGFSAEKSYEANYNHQFEMKR